MSDDKEFRAGAFSGLLAVIMVIALAVMALTALNTTQQPVHMAQFEQAVLKPAPSGVD